MEKSSRHSARKDHGVRHVPRGQRAPQEPAGVLVGAPPSAFGGHEVYRRQLFYEIQPVFPDNVISNISASEARLLPVSAASSVRALSASAGGRASIAGEER